MKRWLLLTVGWGFVVLGVAGLFLPILQGVLFLAIGFIILSRQSPWVRRKLQHLRQRHPEWSKRFDRAADKAAKVLRRFDGRRPE